MLVGNANSSLTLKESPEAESGLRRQHLSELAGVWNVKTQTWKQLLWNDKHVLYFFSSRNLNFYFGLRYEKKFGKQKEWTVGWQAKPRCSDATDSENSKSQRNLLKR